MISKQAASYAEGIAILSSPLHKSAAEGGFRQGAFWACEEILSAMGLIWGFKKRDSAYMDTLRKIVNRIEGQKDVPVK